MKRNQFLCTSVPNKVFNHNGLEILHTGVRSYKYMYNFKVKNYL
jgi:hypothetical protein